MLYMIIYYIYRSMELLCMRFTQSVILVRILARASQSAFYTDESVRTGPESGPLVRSGPRFIAYRDT